MIEYFPLKAYLCQIPLQDVINAGKEYGVAETIDLYINRSEGCDYQLSNIIYQNSLCAVYDDYGITIMISLVDNSIWIDRYRMKSDHSKINVADKWYNNIIHMSYEEFLSASKEQCRVMLSNPTVANSIRKIAASVEVKPIQELCTVTESAVIEDLFDAALEADGDASIEKGLNQLDKISGNTEDAPADDREPAENDGESPDLAQATQDQMDKENEGDEEDPFSSDDPFGSGESGDSDTTDTSTSTGLSDNSGDDSNTNEEDPMKSVEVKSAYRDRFVKLYEIIEDALTTMESFSPDYNTKISARYYTIQMDLTHLKEAIYRICTRRLNKMSVPEVLRAYTIANNIFDISTRMMKEFFDEYNTEVDKMNKKSGNSK